MKKSLLLILLMLLVSSIGNTQSKYPYWSVNVTGGGTLPLGSFGDEYDFGGNAGVDVVYHIDQFWAAYGNGTYNFLKYKGTTSSSTTASLLEVTAGPRYYISTGKTKAHLDAGMGLYTQTLGSSSSSNLGMNVGAGIDVPMSKQVDLVAKAKYHIIFTKGQSTTYGGIYGGVNYNF